MVFVFIPFLRVFLSGFLSFFSFSLRVIFSLPAHFLSAVNSLPSLSSLLCLLCAFPFLVVSQPDAF